MPRAQATSLYFDYPHFPFVTPAELRGERPRHPVAIIGGGPVGLTAALELSRQGIACVLLDDKDTVNEGSRAICLSRHSIETLDQLGLAARFLEKALPWRHGRSYYRGAMIYRLEMPDSEEQRYQPMYNLQQQYIEAHLAEYAARAPGVELRWQSRLTGLRQAEDHVCLSVETPAGSYEMAADYVLAADGARSAARTALGLKLKGDAYEGRYVIADIKIKMDFPTERRCFFDPPTNPGATLLIHKQPEDIWRIDYQLPAGADADAALEEANIRSKISQVLDMIGAPGDWQLEWWSLYKAYTLCLDDYRHGRVLLLGDAAHLVPIFGVRGLNNGISDATNAAWKLACVLRGDAPDSLLDSYSPERRGATMEVFANAAKSTRFMTPPSRGQQLLRDAALGLALSQDFAKALADPRQVEPYDYRDSPLTSQDSVADRFASGPDAGAPALDCRIGDDDFLLDHLGRGFTVLYFADGQALPDDIRGLSAALTVAGAPGRVLAIAAANADDATPIPDPVGAIMARYGASAGTAYLLRPDRHVAGRWRNAGGAKIVSAFERALGR